MTIFCARAAVAGTPDKYVPPVVVYPPVTYPIPAGNDVCGGAGAELVDQQYSNYESLSAHANMSELDFWNYAYNAWYVGDTSYTIPGDTIPGYTILGTPGTPAYTIPQTEQVQSTVGMFTIAFGAASIGVALYETQKRMQ